MNAVVRTVPHGREKKKKGWAASTKEKEKYNGESMEIKDHVKRNM